MTLVTNDAPFIFQTARVPASTVNPSGQPVGAVDRTNAAVAADPDTFDWAYIIQEKLLETGSGNRIKLEVTNEIQPAGTTSYAWSSPTVPNSATVTWEQEDGTDLGSNARTINPIWVHVSAHPGDYTFRCALTSDQANPADRNVDLVVNAQNP